MFAIGWLNMKSAELKIWLVRLSQRWRRKQQQFRAAGGAAEQAEQKPSKAQHVENVMRWTLLIVAHSIKVTVQVPLLPTGEPHTTVYLLPDDTKLMI